jgi:NitT/TauT family transport system ATP-binding protein
VLRIESLEKAFGPHQPNVVEGFDLEVHRGEFVTLIGPSGCGKTTVLRIAAGLLAATSGEIEVDGLPSSGPSRDKAIVFQHFNLFPWRNAVDNVAYGLEIQGMARSEREGIAREYLELMGLAGHHKKYPWQLSGGQQQRIGIARALAINT